jgi:hypothetical protein
MAYQKSFEKIEYADRVTRTKAASGFAMCIEG